MPEIVSNLIDVYPYRMQDASPQYLLLHRDPAVVYAGDWRMIGGKVREGEAASEAARREITEETACNIVRLWTVPSVNSFYERETDTVHLIPAFAAELGCAEPVLNHEHDRFGWFDFEEALERLRWPEQRRLLTAVQEELARGIPVSWRVE